MTQEDTKYRNEIIDKDFVLKMARQAGFWKDLFGYPEFKNHVEAFAKLIAAKEREACAKIAWNMEPDNNGPIETAIRARGETTLRGKQ